MTVSNNVIDDVRVIKEANVLVDLGFEVYIFGNDKEENEFVIDGINVINSKYPMIKKITKNLKTSIAKNDNTTKKINQDRTKFIQTIKRNIIDVFKGFAIAVTIETTKRRIFRKLKETELLFDCIHCHDLDTLGIGAKYKKNKKCKLVYDSHELWTEMSGINKYVKKRYSKKEQKYLNYVDYLITVSPSIIRELNSRYKINIPTVLLRNIPSYDAIQLSTIPNDKKVKLLYIGYFIKGRGIENIIDQAVNFPNNIELTLIVQNKKEILDELNRRVDEKKLNSKVCIKTFVPQNEVINEISKYDIGLLPYLPVSLNNLYCLPNKLFQYLSAGVCVVANNLPDVKSIIDKYECGATYDDFEAQLSIIKELSSNIKKLYQYKKHSLKAIDIELNWEKEKKSLISIYDECKKSEKQ